MHTHRPTDTHTHTHTHANICTYMHTYSHKRTDKHTHRHTDKCTHIQRRSHTHTHTHTHTRCNGYHCWKRTRRHEFKSWMRLMAFPIALIPRGKVWIQLFSLQLWLNSKADRDRLDEETNLGKGKLNRIVSNCNTWNHLTVCKWALGYLKIVTYKLFVYRSYITYF